MYANEIILHVPVLLLALVYFILFLVTFVAPGSSPSRNQIRAAAVNYATA